MGQSSADAASTADSSITTTPTCSSDGWCLYPAAADEHWDGIWASSASDAWAVGGTNTNVPRIMHWDGSQWMYVPKDNGGLGYSAVWGSGATDVWALGDQGSILHGDGQSWSDTTPNTAMQIWDSVKGSGPQDVWAVGPRALNHWTGSAWTPFTISGGVNYEWADVWSVDANTAWAVGAVQLGTAPAIAAWNGASWAATSPPPMCSQNGLLNGVWASAATDVWVTGPCGTLHFDGANWTQSNTMGGRRVWGSSKDDVWVAGASGALMHWDGTAWSPSQSGVTCDLGGVWGVGAHDVWIAAVCGVLHRTQ
jgi:hypothetical protein